MDKIKEVFGTTEWAVANANFLSGCNNNCKYCYSREMAIRFKRKTPENWHVEELNEKAFKRSVPHKDGYIMFPSTHDITPGHLQEAIVFLHRILDKNNDVLLVTKPHLKCIQEICKSFSDYKSRILFRFTIGSANSEVLKFWEPGAPTYEERCEAVIYAYKKGFKTSLSCEPMLDDQIDLVIADLNPYITDSIWLGKMNFALRRMKANGFRDEESLERVNQILMWQSNDNINALYQRLKENPKIKWKESIKKVVGIEVSRIKGEDK